MIAKAKGLGYLYLIAIMLVYKIAHLFFPSFFYQEPVKAIARRYGVRSPQTLPGLQEETSKYAAGIASFAGALGWTDLAAVLQQFRQRLGQVAVERLGEVPGLRPAHARLLQAAGLATPRDVLGADDERIRAALGGCGGGAGGTGSELLVLAEQRVSLELIKSIRRCVAASLGGDARIERPPPEDPAAPLSSSIQVASNAPGPAILHLSTAVPLGDCQDLGTVAGPPPSPTFQMQGSWPGSTGKVIPTPCPQAPAIRPPSATSDRGGRSSDATPAMRPQSAAEHRQGSFGDEKVSSTAGRDAAQSFRAGGVREGARVPESTAPNDCSGNSVSDPKGEHALSKSLPATGASNPHALPSWPMPTRHEAAWKRHQDASLPEHASSCPRAQEAPLTTSTAIDALPKITTIQACARSLPGQKDPAAPAGVLDEILTFLDASAARQDTLASPSTQRACVGIAFHLCRGAVVARWGDLRRIPGSLVPGAETERQSDEDREASVLFIAGFALCWDVGRRLEYFKLTPDTASGLTALLNHPRAVLVR